MDFDAEMNRRLEQARRDRVTSAENEVRQRQEQADRDAEVRRLWEELLDASRQCAARLRAAGVPTQRIIREGPSGLRDDGERGWAWSIGGHRALYELASIRADGQFGRAKLPLRREAMPEGDGPSFIWTTQSEEPPSFGASSLQDFTVRKGAIVMQHYDTRDASYDIGVLDTILSGTARFLAAHE